MGFKSSAHTRYDLKYHFVWIPKYRNKLLTKIRRVYLLHLLKRIAHECGFGIVEVEVMPDHVHLFVEVGPKYSPARVMQLIKSITAREMFKKFPKLRDYLWAGEFWADGYFVSSVGDKITTEKIREYIRHQLN